MSDKRFTAQNMRDTAQVLHYNHPSQLNCEAAAMLRQAADAEDELACLREENIRLAAENARYAARLEAVVNTLLNVNHECRYSNAVSMSKGEYDRILRAARGERGAE